MKKLLSVILIALQMTFVICSVSADDNTDIYVNEDFNSYADNEKSLNVNISGGANSRVLTYPNGRKLNKALLLQCAPDELVSAELSLGEKPSFFLDFEIKAEKAEQGQIILKSASGNEYALFMIDENGSLYLGDGRRLSINTKNEMTRIGVYINTRSKLIGVYSGKYEMLGNYYCKNLPLGINGIAFDILSKENEEALFYINSIRQYSGKKPADVKKSGYSYDVVPFEPAEDGAAEEKIYANVDFEDGKGTFSSSLPKFEGNTLASAGKEGERYYYADVNNNHAHMDHNLNVEARTVFETDVYAESLGGACKLFQMAYTNVSNVDDYVNILPGYKLCTYDGEVAAKLSKNKWYRIAIAVDMNRKCFDVYVDGKPVRNKYPIKTQAAKKAKWTRLRFETSGGPTKVRIDNFRIYSGKMPRDLQQNGV